MMYNIIFLCYVFVWCPFFFLTSLIADGPPCIAINVSVQHNGGLLPDIILLTQCYYHRGTRLNAIKRFCIYLQPMMPNVLAFPPLTGGCSEGLDAFRFFFKKIGAWVNSKMSRKNPPSYGTNILFAMQVPLTGECSEGLDAFRFFVKNKDKRHDKLRLQLNLLRWV